jgi:MerR family transcriptional regulator, repressor of the yfmOP operon
MGRTSQVHPATTGPSGAQAETLDRGSGTPPEGTGLRIGDAAARAGVSARTLRYYEELGLLTPSGYTAGGERRYREADLAQLDRILELREVLGMNLEEIKSFLESENRLEEVREAYRANKGLGTKPARARQRALLEEALHLNETLAEQVATKISRMDDFRDRLVASAQRCRELLDEL